MARYTEQQLQWIHGREDVYRRRTAQEQMQNDGAMWGAFLRSPGNPDAGAVVNKLFGVFRSGGLMYRPSKKVTAWRLWASEGWPVASAISHGGRVMIQLPRADTSGSNPHYDRATDHDDTFWHWLLGPGGREAVGMKLRVATHGLSILSHPIALTAGRQKLMKEEKGKTTAMASQNIDIGAWWFGMEGREAHHRHYGFNVAVGGAGNWSETTRETIYVNGENGHVYVYYMAPKTQRNGGLLIGCEGSEAGHYDQFGHKHTAAATSSEFSPTFGQKWRFLGMGPQDAHDDLMVDLSNRDHLNHLMSRISRGGMDVNNATAAANQPLITPPVLTEGSGGSNIPTISKWKSMSSGGMFHIRSKSSVTEIDALVQRYERDKLGNNRGMTLAMLAYAVQGYRSDHQGVRTDRTKAVEKLFLLIQQEYRMLNMGNPPAMHLAARRRPR